LDSISRPDRFSCIFMKYSKFIRRRRESRTHHPKHSTIVTSGSKNVFHNNRALAIDRLLFFYRIKKRKKNPSSVEFSRTSFSDQARLHWQRSIEKSQTYLHQESRHVVFHGLLHVVVKNASLTARLSNQGVQRRFDGQKRSLKFFKRSLTTEHNLTSLHNHPQNTLKPRFVTISVFRWNSCGLSQHFNGHQG